MTSGFRWLNEPAYWLENETGTFVRTDDRTDFWRKTEYGFIRDNGHFRYLPVRGDFSAETAFVADYQALYDQAGLMLRLDETRWIKAGVELTDGVMQLSVVVTNDTSDWSMIPLDDVPTNIQVAVRLARAADTTTIQYRLAQLPWRTARVAGFPYDEHASVGLMCCSPQRSGFEVQFHAFALNPVQQG